MRCALDEWKGIEVANLVKPANRVLFVACVVLTGALADAHGMQYSLLAISALCLFPVLCIALKKQVR